MRWTTTDRWRRALVLDLALYNLAVIALAVIPTSTLIPPEWVAIIGSGLCLAGLLCHASNRIHVWGEQWAYLGTAVVGVVTLTGFILNAETTATYELAVPLFLLAGVASAGAAHLIDGGVPRRSDGG